MTRRTGWVAHYTLRLGLLLGGVAVAWGAHEAAAGSAAHAADRPPLTAAVEALTHTLDAVLGLPASLSDGVEPTSDAAPASGTTAPTSDATASTDAPAPPRPRRPRPGRTRRRRHRSPRRRSPAGSSRRW